MRVIALMYHDVVERGAEDASGFAGPEAGIYKLDRARFEEHLKAIDQAAHGRNAIATELAPGGDQHTPFCLTFDDGGVSAVTTAADLLERFGMRGHFLVTAGKIGHAGFLTSEQIKTLHARGHVIGSHSYSHPLRMSFCTPAELREEWGKSCEILSNITGEPIRVASVCGGYYSPAVAQAAEEAGIRFLFNSEPRSDVTRVGECKILGRYTIKHWMPPSMAASLARGDAITSFKQRVLWETKKVSKIVGGEMYVKLSRAILRRSKVRARA